MREYLWAYSRVSRYEYLKAVIPALIIATLIAADDMTFLSNIYYYLGVLSTFLTYMSGFIVNAITDYDIDSKYGTYKGDTPRAVDLLGRNTVWLILLVHVGVSLVITAVIAASTGRYILLPLLIVGYFFGLGYSLKPFEFKVRGIWHPISLATSAMLFPLLYLYILISPAIETMDLVFIVGFSTLHYALAITNQAVDYFEDKENGVHNPTVVFGLSRSLRYTLGFMALGLIMMLYPIYSYISAGVEGSTLLRPFGLYVPAAAFALVFIGYSVPFRGARNLLSISQSAIPDERKADLMKSSINYSLWHATGIAAVAAVVLLVFTSIQYYPVQLAEVPGLEKVEGVSISQPVITAERSGFAYAALIEYNITNTGDLLEGGTLEVEYVLSDGTGTRTFADVIPGMLPPNTTIPMRFFATLRDVSRTEINISVSLDRDGNGIYEETVAWKRVTLTVDDIYFPVKPVVRTSLGQSALLTTVQFSALNLGNERDDVMVSIKATYSGMNVVNITVRPSESLGCNYNWTDTRTFSVPLYGEVVVTLELYSGGVLKDRYSTTINPKYFL